MHFRTLRDFIGYNVLTKDDSAGKFSNQIQRTKKRPKTASDRGRKYNAFWFLKDLQTTQKSEDLAQQVAIVETYAQEIFRLYNPIQPKTRLVPNNKGIYTLISSKDMGADAKCLDSFSDKDNYYYFSRNHFKGLGQIIVLSLLLNEGDLKFGNLYSKSDQLIKIDGDMCFWGNKSNLITTNDLALAPHVQDYKAYNWLDIRYREKKFAPMISKQLSEEDKSDFHHSYIFPESFRKNKLFRQEVNKTILEILLTPSGIFRQVLHDVLLNVKNVGAIKRRLDSTIENRKQQLNDAAMKLPDFRQFLQTNQARIFKDEFITKLKAYRTRSKRHLYVELYEADINAAFEKLLPQKRKASEIGLFSQYEPPQKKSLVEQLSEYFFGI